VLFFLPWLDTSRVRSMRYRPLAQIFFALLVGACILLGYLGAKPPEGVYVPLAQLGTAYYFAYFLIVLPLLGVIETPRPLPRSIAEAVLKQPKPAATGMTGGAPQPAE
jgi:quinol-cytochrome oxidoreductase complex cytochrome b subunit